MMQTQAIDWNERRSYLGGSDMPSILGVPGAFGTPLSVFLEKTRPVADRDEGSYSMRRGNALESFLLREFERKTGLKVYRDPLDCARPAWLPLWWRGNLDAWTRVDGVEVPIEAKSAGRFTLGEWGEDGSDQVPLPYLVQTTHYMPLTNDAPFGYVVSDLAGDEARVYRVPRVEAVIAKMLAAGSQFWNAVELGVPPDPTTPNEAVQLWRKAIPGEVVEATAEDAVLIEELRRARDAAKVAEEKLDEIKLEVQKRLRTAEAILVDGRPAVTWKTVTANRFQLDEFREKHPDLAKQFTEATQSRRFYIPKPKEKK
jgi:predicted phage-related endonuclease